MLTDPDTGCIIGIEEMREPKNNALALKAFIRAVRQYPEVDGILYDRMCSLFNAASKKEELSGSR